MTKAKGKESKKALVLRGMEQDRQRLLMRQPFIGMVMMHLNLIPVADRSLDTAATDGESIFMSCNFYASLNLEERLFVMAHEVWHCVFMHIARLQSREGKRFNYATDLEIHFALLAEQMKEPHVLPHDPSWQGLSAEEIYEKLKDMKNRKRKNWHKGSSTESINPPLGQGFDKHVYDNDGTVDGADFAPNISKANIERIRTIVIQAAQTIERTQGHLPAHIKKVVSKLKQPQLDWKTLLRNFVTSSYTSCRSWLPPNRRYINQGLYLQSIRSEQLKALLAIDTSGSTYIDLSQFFAELIGLLNSFSDYEITVIQCDMEIKKVELFSSDNPPSKDYNWEVIGLGGTSFCPVFEYITEKDLQPEIMIYLTDGYGDAPKNPPPYPMLWGLTHDGEAPATWGQSIRLSKDKT